jgi:membrane protein DedA with SNARE-associated domain
VRLYAAVFLATLSTVFLPLPEEATLLAAGYGARLGRLTLLGGMVAGWLAVVLGDCFSYWVGRALLARLLRTPLGRRLLPEEQRRWAEQFVTVHSARAIVVARFLVGVRGFVYFAVGASRHPFPRFLAIDAAVGVVEVGGLVGLGYAFGALRTHAGVLVDLAVAAVLLMALFGPVLLRGRRWRVPAPRS